MFFFKLYQSSNLGHKLHVEEWVPTVNDALMITMQLGIIGVISSSMYILALNYQVIITFPSLTSIRLQHNPILTLPDDFVGIS